MLTIAKGRPIEIRCYYATETDGNPIIASADEIRASLAGTAAIVGADYITVQQDVHGDTYYRLRFTKFYTLRRLNPCAYVLRLQIGERKLRIKDIFAIDTYHPNDNTGLQPGDTCVIRLTLTETPTGAITWAEDVTVPGTLEAIRIGENNYMMEDRVITLPPYPSLLSELNEDSFHQTVSQADRTAWNSALDKIPAGASSSNKLITNTELADAIDLASQVYRGMNDFAATEGELLQWANLLTHNLNDYILWKRTDSFGNVTYTKYRYDGSEWQVEFTINSNSFTSAQWAAINSGLTSAHLLQMDTDIANLLAAIQDAATIEELDRKLDKFSLGEHDLPVWFDANKQPQVIDALSVPGDIQSTAGGVSAQGIADLSVSGGGSGTLTLIYVGDTPYPDVNGVVNLPAYPSALSQLTDDSTHRLVTDSLIDYWTEKYNFPTGGIPKTDLSSSVQTTLDAADSTATRLSTLLTSLISKGAHNLPIYFDSNAVAQEIDSLLVSGDIQSTSGGVSAKGIADLSTSGGAGGTITEIQINGHPYPDVNGIVNLPAYPSALSELTADSAHRVVTDSQITYWSDKYDLPSGGIPVTDLSSAVQISLGKADSALQQESDPVFTASAAHGISSSDISSWSDAVTRLGNLVTGLTSKGTHNLPIYLNANAQAVTIDSLRVPGNIQSTDGGVSAYGISTLQMGGSGGGGTVTGIKFVGAPSTIYEPSDGLITLPDYPSLTGYATQNWVASNFADKTYESRVITIELKIPAQASSTNQLADKDFVNSSISTATATFKGTVTAAGDSEAQAQTALASITGMDANDYAFVKVENTPQVGVDKFKRYKYTGSAWSYEYTLNNSSFTSDQWTAINSGITGTKVSSYDSHLLNTSNPHSVTKAQIGLGNVEDTALSTWAGTTNITTLGTIATGEWHGTAIADSYITSAGTWNNAVTTLTNLKTGLTSKGAHDLPVYLNSSAQAVAIDALSVPGNIQSTAGGVSAKGIATLELGGSGGSGTLTQIQINGTPLTDVSGVVNIPLASSSVNGAMASTDKSKLDNIEAYANNYVLPAATASALGGIKVGTNLSIDASGVLSAVDTTYSSLPAASGGTAVSLVTTGEKYLWNNSFLPLSGGTMTGTIYGNSGNGLIVQSLNTGSWNEGIRVYPNASNGYCLLSLQDTSSNNVFAMVANPYSNLYYFDVVDSGTLYQILMPHKAGTIALTNDFATASVNYATSAGDADTLDGQHGSYYAAASSLSNYLPLTGGTISGSNYPLLAIDSGHPDGPAITQKYLSNSKSNWGYYAYGGYTYLSNETTHAEIRITDNGTLQFTPDYTSVSGQTIWHSGNDGTGSGLDADTLDGEHATSFLRYEGWWDGSDTSLSVDNATGMIFAYAAHGVPTNWGTVATFSYARSTSYNLQLFGEGYFGGLYYRTKSPDTGQHPWRVVIDDNNWSSYIGTSSNYVGYANYATSAGNADTLDSYHENSFLRYRGNTYTDGEDTLWGQIGIKQYENSLPDGLTNSGTYNWGAVVSLAAYNSRLEFYASHFSSDGFNLYYRTGWNNDKRPWRYLIDSYNIGSQSVNYATSAGGIYPISSTPDNATGNGYDALTWYSWGLGGIANTSYACGITIGSNPSDPNYGFQIGQELWYDRLYVRRRNNGGWANWKSIAYLDDNVASATQLQTSRTLWGQSFNGTADIGTDKYAKMPYLLFRTVTSGSDATIGYVGRDASNNVIHLTSYSGVPVSIGTGQQDDLYITTGHNVGFGTTNPSEKVHVIGNILSSGNIVANGGVAARGMATLQSGTGAGISVTQINIGTDPYTPTNGVVSLPAYPTWSTLSGKPTNVSDFTNDSGYIDSSALAVTFTSTTLTSSSTSVYLNNTVQRDTLQKVTISSANANQTFTINLTGSGTYYGYHRKVLVINNSGQNIYIQLAGASYIYMGSYDTITNVGPQRTDSNPIQMDDALNAMYLLDVIEASSSEWPIVKVTHMGTWAD